ELELHVLGPDHITLEKAVPAPSFLGQTQAASGMRLLYLDELGRPNKLSRQTDIILNHPIAQMDRLKGPCRILVSENMRRKKGHKKLQFCVKKAAHDNLQYLCSNTPACCIDRYKNAAQVLHLLVRLVSVNYDRAIPTQRLGGVVPCSL
ncbi:hypothetical protein A1F97_11387, partial [Pyrenophora tritici-repentis]